MHPRLSLVHLAGLNVHAEVGVGKNHLALDMYTCS